MNNFVSINTGPLNGLSSLTYYIAKPLHEFSVGFSSGRFERIEWDMTNIVPLHQSMVTLTAFLAICHRLRVFTGCPQSVKLNWNPRILAFWNDISFLSITNRYDLIEWPEELMGGFPSKVTNPNTIIIDFPFNDDVPDQADLESWKEWKDSTRERVKQELLLRCGSLFLETKTKPKFPSKFKDQVAITSAELVVNALLHGKSTAFIGLQRSSSGITISVCDCGYGFLSSLRKPGRPWASFEKLTNIQAITIGSLENTREMGLRRAISSVVNFGGHVLIASNNAEIRWERSMWNDVRTTDLSFLKNPIRLPNTESLLGPEIKAKVSNEQKQKGYYRTWPYGLRGTRISFELDFKKYEYALKGAENA